MAAGDLPRSWDELRDAFAAVSEADPALRPGVLLEIERRDPELAAEVRDLLAHDAGPMDDSTGAAESGSASEPKGASASSSSSAPAATNGEPALPATISRYRIETLVASGGSSDVFKARSDMPPRPVAIKVLRSAADPSVVTSSQVRDAARRFDEEARVLARLRHPAIVPVLDAGVAEIRGVERRYLVLEYVGGVPITEWAARPEVEHDPRTVVTAVRDLARAVAHAHSRSIVHRDLKPANVLVEVRDGAAQVRVLDFGIARLLDEPGAPAATRLTRGGDVLGTLGYLAPEQMLGDPDAVTAAVDVHALGLILHECLTGRRAVDIPSGPLIQQLRAASTARPARLREIRPKLDEELTVIVETALARDPGDRYGAAAGLAEDLDRWLRGVPITARPVPLIRSLRDWTARHRVTAGVAVALGVTLPVSVLVVGFAIGKSRASQNALQDTTIGLTAPMVTLIEQISRRVGADAQLNEAVVSMLATIEETYSNLAADATLEDPVLAEFAIDTHGDVWRRGAGATAIFRAPSPGSAIDARSLPEWRAIRHSYVGLIDRVSDLELARRDVASAVRRRLLVLALRAERLAEDPDDRERLRNFGIAQVKLGDALGQIGRYDLTLALYERTLQIDLRLMAEYDAEFACHFDDAMFGLNRIAFVHWRIGNLDRAMRLWDERIWRTRDRLDRYTPADGKVWGHLRHGIVQAQGAMAGALEAADPKRYAERIGDLRRDEAAGWIELEAALPSDIEFVAGAMKARARGLRDRIATCADPRADPVIDDLRDDLVRRCDELESADAKSRLVRSSVCKGRLAAAWALWAAGRTLASEELVERAFDGVVAGDATSEFGAIEWNVLSNIAWRQWREAPERRRNRSMLEFAVRAGARFEAEALTLDVEYGDPLPDEPTPIVRLMRSINGLRTCLAETPATSDP